MSIPYGSIIAQLRDRQLQIAQEKARREQQKAAMTQQLVTLGAMAVGAAFGGIPALAGATGLGAGGMGGALTGAGMGQAAGGLIGGAASGQLDPMGAVAGGLGLAGSVYGMGERGQDRNLLRSLQADRAGYKQLNSFGELEDANLETIIDIGGEEWAKPMGAGQGIGAGQGETLDGTWTLGKGGEWTFRSKGDLTPDQMTEISKKAGWELGSAAPAAAPDIDLDIEPRNVLGHVRDFFSSGTPALEESFPDAVQEALGKVGEANVDEATKGAAESAINAISESALAVEEKISRIGEVLKRLFGGE